MSKALVGAVESDREVRRTKSKTPGQNSADDGGKVTIVREVDDEGTKRNRHKFSLIQTF